MICGSSTSVRSHALDIVTVNPFNSFLPVMSVRPPSVFSGRRCTNTSCLTQLDVRINPFVFGQRRRQYTRRQWKEIREAQILEIRARRDSLRSSLIQKYEEEVRFKKPRKVNRFPQLSYGSQSSHLESYQSSKDDVHCGIFWDIENVHNDSYPPAIVIEAIRDFAGCRITPVFQAYMSRPPYPPETRTHAIYAQLGVTFIHCYGLGKDTADKKIISDMWKFYASFQKFSTKTPIRIILITGDRDFADAIGQLRNLGVEIRILTGAVHETSPVYDDYTLGMRVLPLLGVIQARARDSNDLNVYQGTNGWLASAEAQMERLDLIDENGTAVAGKRLPDRSSPNNGATAQAEKGISIKETSRQEAYESVAIPHSSADTKLVAITDVPSSNSENMKTTSEITSSGPKALSSKESHDASKFTNTNSFPSGMTYMGATSTGVSGETTTDVKPSETAATATSEQLHSNGPVLTKPPDDTTATNSAYLASTGDEQEDRTDKGISAGIFRRLTNLVGTLTRTEANGTIIRTPKPNVDLPKSLKPLMETSSETPSTPHEMRTNSLADTCSVPSSSTLAIGESTQTTLTSSLEPLSTSTPPSSITPSMQTISPVTKPAAPLASAAISEPENQSPLDTEQKSTPNKGSDTTISPMDYLTSRPMSSRHLIEPVARNQSLNDVSLSQPPLIHFNTETLASYRALQKTFVRFPEPSSSSPEALVDHYAKQIGTHKPPEICQHDIESIWQSWLKVLTWSGQELDEAAVRRAAQMTLGVAAKISGLRKEAKERNEEVETWMKERERTIITEMLETKETWYPLTDAKTGVDQNGFKSTASVAVAKEKSQNRDKPAHQKSQGQGNLAKSRNCDSAPLGAKMTTSEQVSLPHVSSADLQNSTPPASALETTQSAEKLQIPPKTEVKGLTANP